MGSQWRSHDNTVNMATRIGIKHKKGTYAANLSGCFSTSFSKLYTLSVVQNRSLMMIL